MNSNDKKNLIKSIVAVVAITLIVVGGTYAYWTWNSSDEQKTNVSVTVKGGSLTITGDNVTSTAMRPTNNCSGAAALVGTATVTAKNETATVMKATLKLRGSLTARQGTLDETNKAYLKWAVVDTTSTTTKTCASPDFSGTLANVTTDTDIEVTKVEVPANSTVTKNYTVYVWLDHNYDGEPSIGTTVSDPMQDLTLSVKWSPASTLEQS